MDISRGYDLPAPTPGPRPEAPRSAPTGCVCVGPWRRPGMDGPWLMGGGSNGRSRGERSGSAPGAKLQVESAPVGLMEGLYGSFKPLKEVNAWVFFAC